jgi:hypothetical protein
VNDKIDFVYIDKAKIKEYLFENESKQMYDIHVDQFDMNYQNQQF